MADPVAWPEGPAIVSTADARAKERLTAWAKRMGTRAIHRIPQAQCEHLLMDLDDATEQHHALSALRRAFERLVGRNNDEKEEEKKGALTVRTPVYWTVVFPPSSSDRAGALRVGLLDLTRRAHAKGAEIHWNLQGAVPPGCWTAGSKGLVPCVEALSLSALPSEPLPPQLLALAVDLHGLRMAPSTWRTQTDAQIKALGKLVAPVQKTLQVLHLKFVAFTDTTALNLTLAWPKPADNHVLLLEYPIRLDGRALQVLLQHFKAVRLVRPCDVYHDAETNAAHPTPVPWFPDRFEREQLALPELSVPPDYPDQLQHWAQDMDSATAHGL